MEFLKKTKKGFTLLELIIALGIFTIVMAVVFPFFLSNYKTINNTSIKSELQSEAENIMSYISKSFMEGSSIENINCIENDYVDYVKIKLDNNNYYFFRVDKNKLIYGWNEAGTEKERVIGENVSKLQITPFPQEKNNLASVRGADIEILLENKDISYKLQDHIFLRNSN